ncbi:RNase adapter RapZ [Pajaroellobacter abortibovis]|uniref:RNase adaptor protein RapZ n=1 Tax=Pajaroellobacter abortibovis TaxID=1882918 RepID=A0A1L6MX48_9BACT|nr:RNase adapter RapZ [Pajaroellobacter abortibovis]APS00123.1 RNase adaptor protein RapZ [Pajaroellobacter abortibovis]
MNEHSDPSKAAACRTNVTIITGLSGAGKTTALHALEDRGFFCVDNLPTPLIPETVRVCEGDEIAHLALGIDARVGSFLTSIEKIIHLLKKEEKREIRLLFLDASDEVLLSRFKETRRPHPVRIRPANSERTDSFAIIDSIALERERLAPLRAYATQVIDTTHFSPYDLRNLIITHQSSEDAARMIIRLLSFGFKYGIPVDADFLLDVRFLKNPYFVSYLKASSGEDQECSNFILTLPQTAQFLNHLKELLHFLMPCYEQEGRSHFTMAIGCTGGRHRSVALVNALASFIRDQLKMFVATFHRDLHRPNLVRPRTQDQSNKIQP